MLRTYFIFFFYFNIFFTLPAQALSLFTIEDYLNQVKTQNLKFKSQEQWKEASSLRTYEGHLIFSPYFFTKLSSTIDGKRTSFNFPYDKFITQLYSVGISQKTSFGLEIQLHYNLTSQYYTNLNSSTNSLINLTYTNASPIIELRQNLWNNAFGKASRAKKTQLEAQALALGYQAQDSKKTILSEAEMIYWNLVIARHLVKVQKEALERAQKIYDWNLKRRKLNLAEESDLLQSEALFKVSELDLISSQNQEKDCARQFNETRHLDSDSVTEALSNLTVDFFDKMIIPIVPQSVRDRIKMEEQKNRATAANTEMAIQKNLPVLDVYFKFGLNGQGNISPFPNLKTAVQHSFDTHHPTYVFGLEFSIPLEFTMTQKAKQSWIQEKMAADLDYQQKIFKEEQEWKRLVEKLKEAQKNLELSQTLEKLQSAKANNEQKRFKDGRTTTYQVLMFEQDYLKAQVARIRNQGNILNILAQMKLFGEVL